MDEEKSQKEILFDLITVLDSHTIPYLLTGSFAVSYYGIPRATHDIDIVIEANTQNTARLKTAILSLSKEYIAGETIQGTVVQPKLYCIYHAPTAIKIDLWIVPTNEFNNKFARKKQIRLDEHPISLISSEDLIINKLKWCKEVYSERHIDDCKGIIQIQDTALDMKYLKSNVKILHLETLFKEITSMKLS
jgi:hypothetical protein